MKVIAFYLPQFHEIPENNEWWGQGFTEWVNVKKAVPLVEGQNQPRIPLNNNYYDLSNIEVMKWQAELAKKYGVYGFCFYHYWFSGHKLLEKPAENLLKNKDIDIPFCFCWANDNWTNQWVSGTSQKILMEQKYGDEKEWKEHFDYLLPFFRDERYIKEKGKPLLVIFKPEIIPCLDPMLEKWNLWAKEYGLEGICYAYQMAEESIFGFKNGKDKLFDYQIEYQPTYCRMKQDSGLWNYLRKTKRKVWNKLSKLLHTQKLTTMTYTKRLEIRNYDKDWSYIVQHVPVSPKCIPGAFVDWDNTPRKQIRGSFYVGATPEKFAFYFDRLVKHTKNVYKKDMIFIFAWNEWAEGGYLEPDEKNKYGYLEAIYRALNENGELP